MYGVGVVGVLSHVHLRKLVVFKHLAETDFAVHDQSRSVQRDPVPLV